MNLTKLKEKWKKDNKKISEMTDQELEQEIKEQKVITNLFSLMTLLTFALIAIDTYLKQKIDPMPAFALTLLFTALLGQILITITDRTEKRIREMTGKWNLNQS